MPRIYTRKYTLDEAIFSEIDSPEKAYWLGFIFGDGSVTNLSLRIELSNYDMNHLIKIQSFLKSDAKIFAAKKNCSYIYFNSKKLVKDLNNHNIIKNKTKFSTSLPMIDNYLIKYMILGLLDSDGWISEHKSKKGKSQHEFGFSSSHEEILKYLQDFLVQETGCSKGYISARENKCPQLIIGGNNSFKKLHEYLYNNHELGLDRKRIKSTNFYNEIVSGD